MYQLDLGCFGVVAKDGQKYYIRVINNKAITIHKNNKLILSVKEGWDLDKAVDWINL